MRPDSSLATRSAEDDYCQEHYGRSAVQQMKTIGVLDRPVLAAHCIAVPPDDLPTLAAYPFSAVIAASAGMRSGGGAAPLNSMRKAGINAALGTDNVANNNSYDMFNEMQTAAKLMSLRERQPNVILLLADDMGYPGHRHVRRALRL